MKTIYGKYSLGSGANLSNPDKIYSDIDDAEVIESYKKSISRDLDKSGISLDNIKDYVVLDVGTGRQAIAIHMLGAKRVEHYDLSPENVKRMENYIKINSLQNNITTRCLDLVDCELPKGKHDLVYLNGIVQHFSNVGVGLLNCMGSVKEGGYLWLYFYRSGTFVMFVLELLRDLIKEISDYKEYFINSILLFSDGLNPNYFSSGLMDGLFVQNANLYTPKSYITFVNDCGFEIVSSSKLDPYGRHIDHRYAHQSVVLTCKKVVSKDLSKCNIEILSPDKSINQLDKKIYSSNDMEILETINAYTLLRNTILSKKIPASVTMSIAFRIFAFLEKNSSCGQEKDDRHIQLQNIINNARGLIEQEF